MLMLMIIPVLMQILITVLVLILMLMTILILMTILMLMVILISMLVLMPMPILMTLMSRLGHDQFLHSHFQFSIHRFLYHSMDLLGSLNPLAPYVFIA
jgi:hypothetical protein